MKRSLMIFVCVLTAALLFSVSCEKMQPKPPEDQAKAAAAGKEEPQGSAVSTIAITTAQGVVPISVEIAETHDQLAKGLSGRESLADNAGMWFIFPQMGQESFHMKDMLFALDWIYVDDDMKIVFIRENNQPNDLQPFTPPVPFRYVLEVKAGTVAKDGIKVGDSAEKRVGP